jgi:hypothetical protein
MQRFVNPGGQPVKIAAAHNPPELHRKASHVGEIRTGLLQCSNDADLSSLSVARAA